MSQQQDALAKLRSFACNPDVDTHKIFTREEAKQIVEYIRDLEHIRTLAGSVTQGPGIYDLRKTVRELQRHWSTFSPSPPLGGSDA